MDFEQNDMLMIECKTTRDLGYKHQGHAAFMLNKRATQIRPLNYKQSMFKIAAGSYSAGQALAKKGAQATTICRLWSENCCERLLGPEGKFILLFPFALVDLCTSLPRLSRKQNARDRINK